MGDLLEQADYGFDSLHYVALADTRFANYAKKELSKLPSNSITFQTHHIETWMFSGSSSIAEKDLSDVSRKFSFVDNILKLHSQVELNGDDYSSLEGAIAKVIKKEDSHSFSIEVKKIGFVSEKKAKDIEVILGLHMESLGIIPELKNPKRTILVALTKNIGFVCESSPSNHVDRFRQANASKYAAINRAEYKIIEAMQFFGINPTGYVLDIGAAPGGWTHCLSELGSKIVAIDYGLLFYDKFSNGKKILVLAEHPDEQTLVNATKNFDNITLAAFDSELKYSDFDIIHVRASNIPDVLQHIIKAIGKFGMLMIDINGSSTEGAHLADMSANFMKSGADLVLTVKLQNMAVMRHVSKAEEILSGKYNSVSVKKLPHNREEITLHAARD